MLQKESKIRVLENFYSLDYVFFGKPVAEMSGCCPGLIEEYIGVKGALMSLMIEMYGLIGHKPEAVDMEVSTEDLRHTSKENAKVARENAEELVKTEQGKKDIKAELQIAIEEDENLIIEDIVKEKIQQKAFGLAIDNLLIGRALSETETPEVLNDWEGELVEDAYKVLRDSLVESALFIQEANELTE